MDRRVAGQKALDLVCRDRNWQPADEVQTMVSVGQQTEPQRKQVEAEGQQPASPPGSATLSDAAALNSLHQRNSSRRFPKRSGAGFFYVLLLSSGQEVRSGGTSSSRQDSVELTLPDKNRKNEPINPNRIYFITSTLPFLRMQYLRNKATSHDLHSCSNRVTQTSATQGFFFS